MASVSIVGTSIGAALAISMQAKPLAAAPVRAREPLRNSRRLNVLAICSSLSLGTSRGELIFKLLQAMPGHYAMKDTGYGMRVTCKHLQCVWPWSPGSHPASWLGHVLMDHVATGTTNWQPVR